MFKAILATALIGVIASATAFNFSDDTEYKDYAGRHHANQESLNQLESSQKYISGEMAGYFENCLNERSKSEILNVKKVRKCTLEAGRSRAQEKLDNMMMAILSK